MLKMVMQWNGGRPDILATEPHLYTKIGANLFTCVRTTEFEPTVYVGWQGMSVRGRGSPLAAAG